MKDITILMTAAGSPSTPCAASCFRNLGERAVRIIGTDMKTDPSIEQYIDKCYYAPAATRPEYVDCLLEICRKERVDVLLPGISDELLPLCGRKAEFEASGTKVSVSNAHSIAVCTNKLKFYDFMTENRIPTPKYYPVRRLEEFDEALEKLGYPGKRVCLKATVSSGSRGVRILDAEKSRADILFGEKPNSLYTSREELRSILTEAKSFPEMMAMEFISGPEYSVDLLARDGETLYICGRNSDVVNASIPMEGSLRKDTEAYALCENVVKRLNLDGNADFDFKYDERGRAILMEVNPRQAATMAVFRAGGLNLLYLRVKQLLGETLPECEIRYGVHFKRRYQEFYFNESGDVPMNGKNWGGGRSHSPVTILLSASGSPTMPGLIRCFKANGERPIKIIGMDMSDDPSAHYLCDVFYHVPPATNPAYCNVVLEICKKEKADIYFPNISAEVSAVSERIDEFNGVGTKVSISNREAIDIANNKLRVYEFLRERGLAVPHFYPVRTVEDFEAGCAAMGYPENPVCLKLTAESGSRGVRIIDNSRNRYQIYAHEKPNSFFTSFEDMLSILRSADTLDEMMLVEYMPGNEYTVDLLAERGKVLYIAGRENTVSLMSIAQESIVRRIDSAYETSTRTVELLELDGNIGFDFMKNADGKPVLMDVNPRITATVSLIAAAGMNLPYLRVKQLLGEELPECSLRYGVRLKRRYGEIYTAPDGKRITL